MSSLLKKGFSTSKDVLMRTPLFHYHKDVLKAKMVPLAGKKINSPKSSFFPTVLTKGYEMPLHYPDGTMSEHLHCRESGGFFDISHLGQIK